MADDPFGESPWGDQVSLSGSSVEPAQQPESASHETVAGEHGDSADIMSGIGAGTSSGAGDDGVDQVSSALEHSSLLSTPEKPAAAPSFNASKPKTGRTPVRHPRSRKAITQPVFEQHTVNDPLGPLGESTEPSTESPSTPVTAKPSDVTSNEEDTGTTRSDSTAQHQATATKSKAEGPSPAFHDVPLDLGSSHEAVPEVKSIVSPTHSDLFDISVGDPIKVGDITSAHIVYTVHTKTTSPAFSSSEMSVTRRYRDFRWLLHALENNNPGIIVPPPPDKQAVGRFNEEFVEQRRAALEIMLKKIAAHAVLGNDPDFKLFLESEQFSNDIKSRVMSTEEVDAASSGGLMSSLGGAFSFSPKFIENTQWFVDKKIYLDGLEAQLKALSKSLDLVVTQRRELSETTGEFALVLESLADVEVSKALSDLLVAFSQSQNRIMDLYGRQCMQDIMSLSTTLDEYLRLINSVRSVFAQRQKAYFAVQSAEHELSKKQAHLEKLMRQGKTQQDKISILQQDVDQQDKKVLNARVAFDDISKRIVTEFERLEREKVHDFRNSVELFLENAVESQKEAIEVWETFYERSFAVAS